MFHHTYDLVSREISGPNAFEMAVEIWRHDKTNSFSEFQKSARYCLRQLKRSGAGVAEIVTFKADGKTPYGNMRLQRAWDGYAGELHLLAPADQARRIASYRDESYCLAQGSPPTPPGGIEAEVVAVSGGAAEKDYRGLDVKGKIVLTDAALGSVHQMAKKLGAVGLISDFMATNPVARPTPMDLPDATLWQVMRPEGKLFGFVLSPRQGQWLRRLVQKGAAKKQPVRVRALVDSRVYDGPSELVSARLAGRRDGPEVALIAHLAEPGANDNASGSALCIEIVRTLSALVKAGKLRRPRRGIRVWLTHEFQSLQALAHDRPEQMRRVLAGVNLDFVGQDMDRCGSTLMYQRGPDALPCFIDHLQRALLAHFRVGFYAWGNTGSTQPYFRSLETPFWGNDNFISDPSVGIPTTALINWPDRFYHTSFDTPATMDPTTLARIGALAATFVYTLAAAGPEEALACAELVAEQSSSVFTEEATRHLGAAERKLAQTAADAPPDLGLDLQHALARLDYLAQRETRALQSVKMLLTERQQQRLQPRLTTLAEEVKQAHTQATQRLQRRLAALARSYKLPAPQPAESKPPSAAERKADALIPARKLNGIVSTAHFPKAARDLLSKATKSGLPSHLLFWVDGQRSLLEVGRLAALDDNRRRPSASRLLQWCEGMRRGGAITVRKRRRAAKQDKPAQ